MCGARALVLRGPTLEGRLAEDCAAIRLHVEALRAAAVTCGLTEDAVLRERLHGILHFLQHHLPTHLDLVEQVTGRRRLTASGAGLLPGGDQVTAMTRDLRALSAGPLETVHRRDAGALLVALAAAVDRHRLMLEASLRR